MDRLQERLQDPEPEFHGVGVVGLPAALRQRPRLQGLQGQLGISLRNHLLENPSMLGGLST